MRKNENGALEIQGHDFLDCVFADPAKAALQRAVSFRLGR
jgi:hypothetical protein